MRRFWIGVGLLVLVAGLVAGGGYKLAASRTLQVTGRLVARLPTTDTVVALTFDDGPTADDLEPVLTALRSRGVRATFYVNGAAVEQAPDAARRLVAEGHELGNHTWSHRRMVLVSQQTVAAEIEPTDAAIRQAGYQGPITFRPPYGKKLLNLPLYLEQHHRTTVMWDVAVEDFSSRAAPQSSEDLARETVAQTRPGSVILLHPWHGRTATQQAVGPVIDRLQAAGYRFVTVSEALPG
ncbi:MAG: polysaccharide deacetylase family protein [Actinomycetia bacterium]|nr:polysaccharide deacetylase family protein [Actinomycetes bacterium]